MKRILSFLGALLLSTTLWAGGGIFEAWMTVQTNNENPVAYKVNDGISLGTINQGKMDSVFIKVWKNNGTDITNVWAVCKIDNGDPMEIPCQWGKDLGGNDQEWNAKLDFNFLQGLADGDHKIELWAKAKTNKTDCDEFIYMNNDGANYAMTFTKGTPTPAEEGFGIILSDGSTVKGTKNEGQTEWIEYMIEANLNANATFQLYNFANKYSWTESNIDEASTPNVTINANDVYEVSATGKYTIYLKMYDQENNQVYFAYDGAGTGLNKLKGQAGQRYNIMGQRVSKDYRGMVIMNGQTFIQK